MAVPGGCRGPGGGRCWPGSWPPGSGCSRQDARARTAARPPRRLASRVAGCRQARGAAPPAATASRTPGAGPAAPAAGQPTVVPVPPPPGQLQQTRTLPSAHTQVFRAEMTDLWAAVVTGRASLAAQSFFPLWPIPRSRPSLIRCGLAFPALRGVPARRGRRAPLPGPWRPARHPGPGRPARGRGDLDQPRGLLQRCGLLARGRRALWCTGTAASSARLASRSLPHLLARPVVRGALRGGPPALLGRRGGLRPRPGQASRDPLAGADRPRPAGARERPGLPARARGGDSGGSRWSICVAVPDGRSPITEGCS